MKVLLINPPAENTLPTEVPDFLSEERGPNPPLGLLYLASTLQAAGHDVEVLDSQVEGLRFDGIQGIVRRVKPDLVGTSAMSFTLIDALYTAKAVKDVDGDIKVVFGGPHPPIYPRETVSLPCVDYAVAGEGEHTTTQLIEALEGDEPLGGVEGVAYREGDGVVFTGQSPFIEDLDGLPFPARKLTPYRKYSSLLSKRSPITTLFSSRGCPYKCLFCDRPQMGKRFRARSAKNVVDEMAECVDLGINEFLIYDDTFTIDRQRVLDICAEVKGRGLDVGWDIRARVNTVDRELLHELAAAGCERIHYGVESGNPDILRVLRKGITLKQVQEAFKLTREAGIETLAYFMIGSPRETRETIADTVNFAKKLNAGYVHFSITTPFPATDLYRMGLEEGILKSDYWREYAMNPTPGFTPQVWEENLAKEELIDLLHKAYKRFYVRPAYIVDRLLAVRTPGELWRKIRAGLKVIGS
jgi:anaerobic magnesium-protoporphyrin IX monomethyl ester cyclase